jgi:predicted metal-dependent hydrolase
VPRETVVIRSRERRRTISAQIRGDVMEVRVPWWISKKEEELWVEKMRARFEKARIPATDEELQRRAVQLAGRYLGDDLVPSSVRWAENQIQRWGSCTPDTGTIRISAKLREFPDWVRDYVLVHEIAHLRYSSHGPRFWELVNRYPLTERARGFLIAKGGEAD